MQEKIGNVTLDLFWYPGNDRYSDGPVEDMLLDIARNTQEEDLNRVIAEKKDWSVLYHFSEIRQNIISWLPINRYDHVLEIGSGCGAITGALCNMAGAVTGIELSKKRSTINAYRNRDKDNLRLIVGNFLDIEPNLTENYDYITLIGVFEYAEGYMGEIKPYQKMLECAYRHLAPGGKLVIAIENKLGLKYFAGCTEDHIGVQFKGIEGYPEPAGVRTFSRKELKDMIEGTGYAKTTFYYPYPDYKFPMTIYSDRYLPKPGEIRESFLNYDRQRILLFSEPLAYNSVIEAGLYQEFANSFLVIAEKAEKEAGK
ncbi:MAG: methyltransferase [Blautia sp.]|nr:methyltransferase [Blautia sp.]